MVGKRGCAHVRHRSQRIEQNCRTTRDLGGFRRPVVHSDGASHPPEISPRPARCRVVASGVAPASLSQAIGAFWTGGSNRNKKQGFGGANLYRTRSHGRDIPAELSQSPVPRTLVAKESAASIIPPQYPCLLPVLGSPGLKSHRDPAAGSVGIGQRSRLLAVVAQSTPRLGGGSHGRAVCDDDHGLGPETRRGPENEWSGP